MPVPFLIAGAAAIAGTTGVVKGAKAIHNNAEAKELIEKASTLCETAKKNFEDQKKKTSDGLEKLGTVKIDAWAKGMEAFTSEFSYFKNIQMDEKLNIETALKYAGDDPPDRQLLNMQNAALTAKEIAKIGAVSIGAGAVVGIAIYGGAMMFGKASTGVAISALTGAAAKNATLAWFGGGALKAGGLGMAGGKLLLGGVAVAPVLAVAGFVMEAKSKEKLANARMVYAEAEQSAEEINTMTSYLKGIYDVSHDYGEFIGRFGKIFEPFIVELHKIRTSKEVDENGKIDFNSLTESEQKTLHLSWLMAQIYYQLLSAPILTQDGDIAAEAKPALENAQLALRGIERQTFSMTGADVAAANLIWRGKAMSILSINFFAVGLLVALGILHLKQPLLAFLYLLDAFIACPIFFKFKDLPESRKYVWRIVRLAASAVFLILILFMA